MSSTRDCPTCGREAGFHTPECSARAQAAAPELARIRASAAKLHGEVLVWAADARTRWAHQLVDDMGKVVGTIRWLEGDIERQRVDDEQCARGK